MRYAALSQFYWVWIASAAVLLIVGLGILIWAVLWDRAKGRKRCPNCWYDMSGAAAVEREGRSVWVCPECGRETEKEQALYRTRRRRRWAFVAVVLVVAAPLVAVWSWTQRNGWLTLAPTRVLGWMLWLEKSDGNAPDPVWTAIVFRAQGSNSGGRPCVPMSMDERAMLLEMCVHGLPWARPGSERWRATYGSFLHGGAWALYSVSPTGEVLPGRGCAEPISQRMLDAMRAQEGLAYRLDYIRTREKWPVGIKVIVQARVEHWWPMGMSDELTLRWKTGDGKSGQTREFSGSIPIEIGSTGRVELDVELLVARRVINTASAEVRERQELMGTERARLVYDTTETLEQAMPGVESPVLDGLLKAMPPIVFDGYFRIGPSQLSAMKGKGFDDVAIVARADVRHNGKSVYTAGWTGVLIGDEKAIVGGMQIFKSEVKYLNDNWSKPGWTVVLTSEPEKALELYGAKRCWKGEVELPLVAGEPWGLKRFLPREGEGK